MPEKEQLMLFRLKKMKEQCQEKDKRLYMCFVNLEKTFNRVPRKVMEWAMTKKYQR